MATKPKIVFFTGAGISQESGISTFRDSNGLWEQYKIEDVATPDAWKRNPGLVLEFYNQRRKQVLAARPNKAHELIASLESHFEIQVITQNIDDLHERAGSSKVLHLHGEIIKGRSTVDPSLTHHLTSPNIRLGDKCAKGSQVRPHIVWFGEAVPLMDLAYLHVEQAEIFVTVGTSLNVYPAAGLVDVASLDAKKYLIDPGDFSLGQISGLTHIQEKAVKGMEMLFNKLVQPNV